MERGSPCSANSAGSGKRSREDYDDNLSDVLHAEGNISAEADVSAGEVENMIDNMVALGKFQRSDLDDVILDKLKAASPILAKACFERLRSTDMSAVRNVSGYVHSIFGRVKNDLRRDVHEELDFNTAIKSLDTRVRSFLQSLLFNGDINEKDLDPGVIRDLSEFSGEDGVEILRRFSNKELSSVRNKTGFLIHGPFLLEAADRDA